MQVTYFEDTDTLMVNFSSHEIVKTKDINENTLMELDKSGNIVSLTIEHARQQAEVSTFSYSQLPQKIA